jgi:hypothetical protein
LSSQDFWYMTPREYQLTVKQWVENDKYKNRDICEAIRTESWHNKQCKVDYIDYCTQYFPLTTDNFQKPISEVVHTEEEITDIKNNFKELMKKETI